MDCPGYGRSSGDRQDIRSHPAAVIGSVLSAFRHEAPTPTALCLVGSSQGTCAVFNAVLERPSICEHLAVMDPVGHDVFRYAAIKQPALLTFDVEDDGHPVKVGRWMRDQLPTCIYHEFAGSDEPYWHTDFMATEMLRMFASTLRTRQSRRMQRCHRASNLVDAAQDLTAQVRLAGGLVAWVENTGARP